jgi:hydrogenase maturation protease
VLTGADAPGDAPACIVCLGEKDRGDDGVGPLVAEQIRRSHADVDVRQCHDPFDLLDVISESGSVVVVDAARVVGEPAGASAAAGTIHVVADLEQARASLGLASTHAFGPAEVLALARTVGRARARVTLVAVVGEHFDVGAAAGSAVAAAVPAAAEQAVRLLGQSRRREP